MAKKVKQTLLTPKEQAIANLKQAQDNLLESKQLHENYSANESNLRDILDNAKRAYQEVKNAYEENKSSIEYYLNQIHEDEKALVFAANQVLEAEYGTSK